ncbi:MAG: flagellar hook-basal body complex protein FliE [Spirochaeta sp. LUC14_002_19_P3]|nr:MAG: flagellar hook-basal body complex protein FliE [Spirochaeta sp. LUC14_002_19_P3]
MEITGNIVQMTLTNPRHLNSSGQQAATVQQSDTTGFGTLVMDGLQKAADQQTEANALSEKMLTNPDDVDIHEVTIAMSKAEMGVRMTKALIDRAVKAYTDITMMR